MTTVDTTPPPSPTPTDPKTDDLFRKAVSAAIFQQAVAAFHDNQQQISQAEALRQDNES